MREMLLELPFKAGNGEVEDNLSDVARAALHYYEHGLASAAAGRELPIAASDGSPTSMEADIRAVAGYLDLEQRLGRVRTESLPELVATLLLGGLAAHALGRSVTGDQDEESGIEFADGMVAVLYEGIGTAAASLPADHIPWEPET